MTRYECSVQKESSTYSIHAPLKCIGERGFLWFSCPTYELPRRINLECFALPQRVYKPLVPVFRILAHALEGSDGLDRNVVICTFGVEGPHILVKWEVRIGEIEFHCKAESALVQAEQKHEQARCEVRGANKLKG